MNLAGVHAAQHCDVEGERRYRAGRGAWCRGAAVCRDVGGAGYGLQIRGPHAGIQPDCPRDELGEVGVPRVEPEAIDDERTRADAVAIEAAVGDDWRARGEGGAARVDEAAAIAEDSGRVGDDDFRTGASDFEVAEQLAGVGGIDFVEDDSCTARGEPGVALHESAEAGGGAVAGVVEDGAGSRDVELAVGVARYAGSAGRLDVDEGDAVRGGQDGRALAAGSAAIGDDLRADLGGP